LVNHCFSLGRSVLTPNSGTGRWTDSSPASGSTVTMVWPAKSGSCANRTAAAAPDEIPPRIPSSRISRQAKAIASALSTCSTRSTMERSSVSGMNPAGEYFSAHFAAHFKHSRSEILRMSFAFDIVSPWPSSVCYSSASPRSAAGRPRMTFSHRQKNSRP